MLIRDAVLHSALFSWFIFLAECDILNLLKLESLCAKRHWVDDHLPTIS